MPRQRRQPTNTQHRCQTPSTNSKDASACRLRRRRPLVVEAYIGGPLLSVNSIKEVFDVFLTAFHKPPDFHVFDLYYRTLIVPPALGRALNRPYCPNSFCRIFETGNRRALRGLWISLSGRLVVDLRFFGRQNSHARLGAFRQNGRHLDTGLAALRFSDKRFQARSCCQL